MNTATVPAIAPADPVERNEAAANGAGIAPGTLGEVVGNGGTGVVDAGAAPTPAPEEPAPGGSTAVSQPDGEAGDEQTAGDVADPVSAG